MAEYRSKHRIGMVLAAAALLPAVPAEAADEPAPDIAFIEYLGSWEEDDGDWLVLAGPEPEAGEADAESGRREPNEEEARGDEERS